MITNIETKSKCLRWIIFIKIWYSSYHSISFPLFLNSSIFMKRLFLRFLFFLKRYRYISIVSVIFIITALFVFMPHMMRQKPVCERCNVILVSLDTLSALHLPCYGYQRNTAPNLCRFAKENILFQNSYSQTPFTISSHFSIFTSLYPTTHQMLRPYTGYLKEEYLTLPQVFRLNGYQTIYNGSLTNNPVSYTHLTLPTTPYV